MVWPGLEDIIQLSQMVAEHVACMLLLPHAPPHAVWDGQEVTPPLSYAANDTTALCASLEVRTASGGACLGAAAVGTAALR
jgi:hypothetical protein